MWSFKSWTIPVLLCLILPAMVGSIGNECRSNGDIESSKGDSIQIKINGNSTLFAAPGKQVTVRFGVNFQKASKLIVINVGTL